MMTRTNISTSISRLVISLALLVVASTTTHAQKIFRMEKDSIPLFRGFSVSFDLVGPAMLMFSDHGEIEGALRINLHGLYGGIRYAFTSYKADITRKGLVDPVWQYSTDFGVEGMKCNMHWMEVVLGIDAKIFGPLHLGWDVRYKRRISHKEGDIGQSWYVPGFGINDQDNFAAHFNVIIDI